jgi:AraC-like DNA-binding protein
MHHLYQTRKAMTDSMYLHAFKETRYFDRDSLFIRYAENGYMSVREELRHYYSDILVRMPPDERLKEVEKTTQTIRRLNHKSLFREIDYMKAIALSDSTTYLYNKQMAQLWIVAEQAKSRKDIEIELRTLSFIFQRLYMNQKYSETFSCALRIAQLLEETPESVYPEAPLLWFLLGEVYYNFRDYECAVPYLKRAVRDSVTLFYDRSNLRARNTLGVYYHNIGDLDESDRWFRSMLESPDMVKYRPMYDCIAITNLANNMTERGKYTEAKPLFEAALPVAINENDHTFASGITVKLGETYLLEGDLDKARIMIDSTITLINCFPKFNKHRYRNLYPLMSKYYAVLGDIRLSQTYIDSAMQAVNEYEKQFNSLYILRAEQELFEAENKLKEEKLRNREMTIRGNTVVLVILLLMLIVTIYLYRRKQEAYRQLVLRSKEWAENVRIIIPPERNQADVDDIAIMDAIRQLVEKEKIYRDPELTSDTLSKKLSVSRNAISKAINSTQHKNFNSFINEYRIRESIRLMTDPANDTFTIDAIASDSGFNSRETFYRAFKAQTGITPFQFRKNREL